MQRVLLLSSALVALCDVPPVSAQALPDQPSPGEAVPLDRPGAPPSGAPGGADPSPEIGRGLGMLEEGARSFLRGLMTEAEPRFQELQRGMGDALSELGPELRQLREMLGDLRHYQAPERLPNGDVLIRRREDAPPYVPPAGEAPDSLPEEAPAQEGPPQEEPIEL